MYSTWSNVCCEHGVLPLAEGRHAAARGTGGGELERGVDPLHHLGGLVGDAAVFRRRLGLHLPRPVHLVAEAPELHVMRLFPSVLAAQVRQGRAGRMVAVFDHVAGGVGAARAEIDRQHGLGVGGAAPVDEFVGAELVGLGRHPGEVEPARALGDRTDAVLPIVAGDEVAAGIAHDRGRQLAHQRQHVLAEALGIGRGMAGFEDAAIDAAAEMLDEGAEQARVGAADGEIAMQADLDVTHGGRLLGKFPAPAAAARRASPERRATAPIFSAVASRDAADCRARCAHRRFRRRCPGA